MYHASPCLLSCPSKTLYQPQIVFTRYGGPGRRVPGGAFLGGPCEQRLGAPGDFRTRQGGTVTMCPCVPVRLFPRGLDVLREWHTGASSVWYPAFVACTPGTTSLAAGAHAPWGSAAASFFVMRPFRTNRNSQYCFCFVSLTRTRPVHLTGGRSYVFTAGCCETAWTETASPGLSAWKAGTCSPRMDARGSPSWAAAGHARKAV